MAASLPPISILLGLAGWDATTWILVGLAAVAGYLLYEFIREHRGRSGIALIGAVLGHLLFVVFLSLDVPTRLGCNVVDEEPDLIEFEVAELPEPEPEPPKEEEPPKQEPEEPEPVVEEKPPEPKPEPPKPKPKKAPEPQPEPQPQPEPAPAKRWDLSQTTQGGASGVVVQQGSGGEYGGTGSADSKGKAKNTKPPAGDPKGDENGTAAKWEPRSELFVKQTPVTLKVPEIDCPATKELGVEGKVVLRVQVQRDGKIRKVTLVSGIGNGCDEVAIKALKKARFKPAVATNGQPVDFELTYDYVFTLKD